MRRDIPAREKNKCPADFTRYSGLFTKTAFVMRRLYPISLLLVFQFAHAQQTHTVVDSLTRVPLPFATIKVLHTPKGEIASETGTFRLQAAPDDTLLISSVGYNHKRLLAKDLGEFVFITPKIGKLLTVTVRQSVAVRRIPLGNGVPFLDRDISCTWDGSPLDTTMFCVPWGSAVDKAEFAEHIVLPDSTKVYRLLRVVMPTRGKRPSGELLIHLYEADDSSGAPGTEFFVRQVSVNRKNVKNRKVTFDLASENLLLHGQKSFFVSFSWGGNGEGSGIAIGLYRIPVYNTYSRTLANTSYDWFPFMVTTAKAKYSTAYAVELEERVYK